MIKFYDILVFLRGDLRPRPDYYANLPTLPTIFIEFSYRPTHGHIMHPEKQTNFRIHGLYPSLRLNRITHCENPSSPVARFLRLASGRSVVNLA